MGVSYDVAVGRGIGAGGDTVERTEPLPERFMEISVRWEKGRRALIDLNVV